jgi:hypothetical protein
MEIKIVSWDFYTDTGLGQTYITDIDDVPLRQDGMVFAIAVVPQGKEIVMPEWAANLPALGAADSGNVPQTTIDPNDTTAATTPDTGATDSTTAGTTPDTGSTPDTGTTPSTGEPDTTATGG